MPKQDQPHRVCSDAYNKYALYRELEFLHDRLNRLLVDSAIEDLVEDLASTLNQSYAATDVDTAAEVAAAFNTTNTALNSLIDSVNDTNVAVNAILAKIREESI